MGGGRRRSVRLGGVPDAVVRLLVPGWLRVARAVALAAACSLAAGLAGCGDAAPPVAKLTTAEVKAKLAEPVAGQSAAERGLEQEASELLDVKPAGAVKTLEARVAALKGTPVVVNLWADWCGPCKREMPILQRVALGNRGEIAFLGVAVNSPRAKAEAFLRNVFVPYPSLLDADGDVNIGTGVNSLPKTFFYDRSGKRTIHIGPYETEADLLADIKRYAS